MHFAVDDRSSRSQDWRLLKLPIFYDEKLKIEWKLKTKEWTEWRAVLNPI